MHADFNVLNNCKISNCQIPNYAPRFHLIILFQLLFTYLLAMPATEHFLKAKTALFCVAVHSGPVGHGWHAGILRCLLIWEI